MVYFSAKNISHSYEGVSIVDCVDLDIEAGQLVCLLGPSGCGKSTLLRLIAGLEKPLSGQVTLSDKILLDDNTYIPIEKRNVGMVFQTPSLFPHMTVLENVMFAVHGDKKDGRQLALELLDKVDMALEVDRYPESLSGGEQQRVALARTLASQPDVIMMDEPFANLDAVLRKTIRNQTRLLLNKAKIATLLVTHEPEEALQLADKIYVMQQGRVIQSGTPNELYNSPKNIFVASFFGVLNAFKMTVCNNKLKGAFNNINMPTSAKENVADGEVLTVHVRPEAISLTKAGKGDTQAVVTLVRFMGSIAMVELELLQEKQIIQVQVLGNDAPELGSKVGLVLDQSKIFIFID